MKNLLENYDNQFLDKRDVIVRVYVIGCTNLFPMDRGSDSDPYIQISMGKKKVNNRERY